MPGKRKGGHVAERLSSVAVTRVRDGKGKPGRLYDGRGLFLEVQPSGSAHWLQRLTVHGRRREMGLGSIVTTTLAEARRLAVENLTLARKGEDPIQFRRTEVASKTAPDFEGAARQCYELREGAWRNEKHRDQWLSSLEAYVFPKMGKKRLNTISSADILEVLTPIWTAKHATALRVRQRIGVVLDWSKAKGWRTEGNPVADLAKALPAVNRVKKHHPAMPHAEVPAFLSEVRGSGSTAQAKAAMETLVLTATRTNETLAARIPELDLAKAVWTIPGERMKAKKPHVVPLAPRVVELLRAVLAAHSGKGDFVFESRAGKPLSQMALLAMMRRMKLKTVPHGFRSSFRDFAAEKTNASREVAEEALAHTLKDKVEAAYRRTDLLEKRRKLMTQWATYCAGGGAVVKLVRKDEAGKGGKAA